MSRISAVRSIDLDVLAQHLLQLALLARRELVVEDDDVGAQLRHQQLQLVQLARADQRRRVGRVQPLGQPPDHDQVSRLGQQGELVQRILQRQRRGPAEDIHADQQRLLHQAARWRPAPVSFARHRLARAASPLQALFLSRLVVQTSLD